MEDDQPLVAYGEGTGPPLRWPSYRLPRGSASVQQPEQQCDDDTYLETLWQEPEGLYNNVEGEAIGDFT